MSKQRTEYIDTVKGIAIFLVVLGHVLKYMLPVGSVAYNLIYAFHMPLFFCISGYFGYTTYQKQSFLKILRGKSLSILLPFLMWGILYAYYQQTPTVNLILDPYNLGYWFLITLFYLFLIALLLRSVNKWTNHLIIELIIYVLPFALFVLIEKQFIHLPHLWERILNAHFICKYYPFFIAGWIISKHQSKLLSWNQDILYSLSIVLFIVSFLLKELLLRNQPILIILCGLTGSYCMIYLTKKYDFRMPLQSTFRYMGVHSINIYVIHYFFLNLSFDFLYPTLFGSGNNSVLCYLIAIVIAICISLLCILFSIIISSSKLLNVLLFGKKESLILKWNK